MWSGCRRSTAPRPERDRSGREPRRGARHGVHRRPSAAPRQAWLVRQRAAHPARGAGGAARAVRQLRRRGTGRHPGTCCAWRRHALAMTTHLDLRSRNAGASSRRCSTSWCRARARRPRCWAISTSGGRAAADDRVAPPRRAAAFTPDVSGLAAGAQAGPHRVLGHLAARRGAPAVHPADAARPTICRSSPICSRTRRCRCR